MPTKNGVSPIRSHRTLRIQSDQSGIQVRQRARQVQKRETPNPENCPFQHCHARIERRAGLPPRPRVTRIPLMQRQNYVSTKRFPHKGFDWSYVPAKVQAQGRCAISSRSAPSGDERIIRIEDRAITPPGPVDGWIGPLFAHKRLGLMQNVRATRGKPN